MGFVNEILSKNEIKEYQIPNYRSVKPSICTIDREKNIRLFCYWTDIDKNDEKYFALIWKDNIVKIIFTQEILEANTVRWNIKNISIPKKLELEKNEILSILREAMCVYGFSGYPFIKEKTEKVIISF